MKHCFTFACLVRLALTINYELSDLLVRFCMLFLDCSFKDSIYYLT
jgi:hypothetical protein